MAVININSGGPEGKEREFGLTWSSDLPSVRKPYTRKAHILEDDVVFKGTEAAIPELNIRFDSTTNAIGGFSLDGPVKVNLHVDKDTPPTLYVPDLNIEDFSGLAVYVPAEAVDDYKEASVWSDYADFIFAEPEEEEETQEETPGEP